MKTANLEVSGALTTDRVDVIGSTVPSNGLYLASTNTLGFSSNSTERFTIDANGKTTFNSSVKIPNRYSYGGTNNTQNTTNWWSIGLIQLDDSEAATLRIQGTQSYSTGLSIAGETVIHLRGNAENGLEGYFYGFTQGNNLVTSVAYKNTTTNTFQIWIKLATFQAANVYCDSVGVYTPEGVDTGSETQPAGSTLLTSFYTIATSGTEKVRIDSNGRIGLGVAPTTWTSGAGFFGYPNIDFAGGTAIAINYPGSQPTLQLNANGYYNDGWKYKTNGYSSRVLLGQNISFEVAPSGAIADAALSYTNVLTLSSNGKFGFNDTPDTNLSNYLFKIGDYQSGSDRRGLCVSNRTDTTLQFLSLGSGIARIGTDAAGRQLSFATGNNVEAMRIDSDGNVGISTTSLTEKFNCYKYQNAISNMLIINDNSGSAAGSGLKISSYGNTWQLYTGSSANNGNAFAIKDVVANADRISIDSSGNMGIGTSPSFRLHVRGNNDVERIVLDNTVNSSKGAGLYLRTYNGASLVSNATIKTDNAGNMVIYTGTSSDDEKMRIDSSGNVGINQPSPFSVGETYKTLQIKGVSGTSGGYILSDSGDGATRAQMGVDGNAVYIGSRTNSQLNLTINNVTKASIDTSGNVIIGTAPSGGGVLQVGGNINTSGVVQVNGTQVLTSRQSAITDAKVDYTTGNLDTEAEIISAINTTNGKINSILGALRAHGLIAP